MDAGCCLYEWEAEEDCMDLSTDYIHDLVLSMTCSILTCCIPVAVIHASLYPRHILYMYTPSTFLYPVHGYTSSIPVFLAVSDPKKSYAQTASDISSKRPPKSHLGTLQPYLLLRPNRCL
jgi:hypothetical protein